ncbi:cache domain-containing protein [Rugamonas apoptosis]|nr:cache domain-containing protein [Rugamonas apoptosis]
MSKWIMGMLLVMAGQLPALAVERSNTEDAVALVNKAIDYLKKNGPEKSITEFNTLASPFNSTSDINKKGDLYLFMFSAKQVTAGQLVHGKNPKIVGKDLSEMRDADGVYLIREIFKTCNSKEGKGWVSYKWPNPVTNTVEAKQSYVVKVDDFCIGTGIYKP